MNSSFRTRALPVTALILGLVALALVAGGAFGRSGAPSEPKPTPTPTAKPTPTATPTPQPTTKPTPGVFTVDLDIADDHDVTVTLDDKTKTLKAVTSGKAGDGMSVRWFDSLVKNDSASKIRITWVGLPLNDDVEMTLTKDGDTYKLSIVQFGPPLQSDAVGFDRVLVLEFDGDVDADDLEIEITKSNA